MRNVRFRTCVVEFEQFQVLLRQGRAHSGVWQRFATNLATSPQLFDPEEIIDSILFAGSVID
jgi:hypothetical protein